MDINRNALDRYITGNYGEDQFRDDDESQLVGTVEQTQKALDLTMDRFTVTLWRDGEKIEEKDFCFFETAREWIIREGYWYDSTPTSAYPSEDSVINPPNRSHVKPLRLEGAQPK